MRGTRPARAPDVLDQAARHGGVRSAANELGMGCYWLFVIIPVYICLAKLKVRTFTANPPRARIIYMVQAFPLSPAAAAAGQPHHSAAPRPTLATWARPRPADHAGGSTTAVGCRTLELSHHEATAVTRVLKSSPGVAGKPRPAAATMPGVSLRPPLAGIHHHHRRRMGAE